MSVSLCLLFILYMVKVTATEKDTVGFVPEPSSGRGTIGLLWQCFATIFLCTYSVLHLDVPPCPLSNLQEFGYSALNVAFNIIMPEAMCIRSFLEFARARAYKKIWNQRLPHRPISLKQAFFLLADGLIVHADAGYSGCDIHCLLWKSLQLQDDNEVKYRLEKLWDEIPPGTEIDAASKTNCLSKAITLGQASWMGAQLIGRVATPIAISLVEVATAGFILAGLVSWLFWYEKPHNIGYARPSKTLRALVEGADSYGGLRRQRSSSTASPFPSFLDRLTNSLASKDYIVSLAPSSFWGKSQTLLLPTCFVLSWLGFAGIHLSAWLYPFPSKIEGWLWQGSAVILAITPVAFAYGIFRFGPDSDAIWELRGWDSFDGDGDLLGTCVVFYLLARLYILFECLFSLRKASAGIYNDSLPWQSYWGHIGN